MPWAGKEVCSCVLMLWVSVFFLWQTYIKSMDKDFVAATIQAIGRCATNIGEVRDTCLNGLVQLLSNRDGESACFPSSSSSLQLGNTWIKNQTEKPGASAEASVAEAS